MRGAEGVAPGPLRLKVAAAERARHARRGACRRDIPGQGRGLRHLRRAQDVQGVARQGSRHRRPRGPAGHAPVGLPEATGRKRPGVRGHRLNPLHEKVRKARRHWLRFHRKAPRGRDGEERCGRLTGQTRARYLCERAVQMGPLKNWIRARRRSCGGSVDLCWQIEFRRQSGNDDFEVSIERLFGEKRDESLRFCG